MTLEVEIKAHLRDPQAVEAKAAQLGTFVKETLKEDMYFRRKGNTQRVPTERYRLRREAGQADSAGVQRGEEPSGREGSGLLLPFPGA